MNKEYLSDLFDHMAWADSKLWSEVLNNEQAIHDAKLNKLLSHIHIVQRFYLCAWRMEPLNASYPQFEQLSDLYNWANAYYCEARGFLESLTDAMLDEPMSSEWEEKMRRLIGPSPTVAKLGDTVMQVILHSQYHRGQANARLRELAGVPPLIDYLVWIWIGRPSATWELKDTESIS
jgi:uncharacterized damage-inducible protein DinB